MDRPANDASEEEVLEFARDWVRLAAAKGFELALSQLDPNPRVSWSPALFNDLISGSLCDGQQPAISNPDEVEGLRVDVYRYNDGSGFAVDHDLPLDGKRSDYTVQLDFRKGSEHYKVLLEDIHVL